MKRMQEKIIEHNSANFTGSVKLEEVEIDILGFKNLRCLKVSFEEGARTYWHKHPSGQILVILSGEGEKIKQYLYADLDDFASGLLTSLDSAVQDQIYLLDKLIQKLDSYEIS